MSIMEQKILQLKKDLNAVILAHYYQESEIQDVADFVGDSLALAQQAAVTKADVIDTSSNAVKIIAKVPKDRPIIFAPDQHLGRWVSKQTGREMVLWPGSCMVHEIFSEKKLVQLKVEHPDAAVIAHPECEAAVLAHADFIGSTKHLLEFTVASPKQKFIVVTEAGILHQMQLASRGKTFIPAPPDNGCACNECPHMRLNTLEKVYRCMRDKTPKLEMPPGLGEAALKPLKLMLEWS